MLGKSRQQEVKGADPITSAVRREQRINIYLLVLKSLPLLHSVQDPLPREQCHLQLVCLAISMNIIKIPPHRYD